MVTIDNLLARKSHSPPVFWIAACKVPREGRSFWEPTSIPLNSIYKFFYMLLQKGRLDFVYQAVNRQFFTKWAK